MEHWAFGVGSEQFLDSQPRQVRSLSPGHRPWELGCIDQMTSHQTIRGPRDISSHPTIPVDNAASRTPVRSFPKGHWHHSKWNFNTSMYSQTGEMITSLIKRKLNLKSRFLGLWEPPRSIWASMDR